VQYSTVQYSTVQYSTVQYSTVQYSALLSDTNLLAAVQVGAGFEPNVVVFTTLLKGHTLVGDVASASSLLARMEQAGIPPDVRCINTFLRGCIRVGATQEAAAVHARMAQVRTCVEATATCHAHSAPPADLHTLALVQLGVNPDATTLQVRDTHLLRSSVDPRCHLPCHATVL